VPQSGRSGTCSPSPRPSRTPRVRDFEPKRSRMSSIVVIDLHAWPHDDRLGAEAASLGFYIGVRAPKALAS
jgi:hypothetical protein